MRRQTAVRRLRTVAERCQRASGLWDDEPFLLAAYAFGSVLESAVDVDVVDLAFVLNLPAEELPWVAEPQSLVGLPSLLEIDKAPVRWYWRPAVWPVANHLIHRPLRVWSLDGPDEAALDALERGQAEHLRMPAPTAEQQQEQLRVELAVSLSHLRWACPVLTDIQDQGTWGLREDVHHHGEHGEEAGTASSVVHA